MLPTLSPQEFVAKWRSATLKERSAAQEHFIDVCRLAGHQTPAEADPAGTSFSFEYGAGKERGGQGWAERLALLRAAFVSPEAFRVRETTEQVTQKAAASFAQLADRLRRYGEDPQRTAHFLIRLLFCLFAEQLRQLFAAMAKGGFFGADEIAHFDGRLFDDDRTLALDADGLEILALNLERSLPFQPSRKLGSFLEG